MADASRRSPFPRLSMLVFGSLFFATRNATFITPPPVFHTSASGSTIIGRAAQFLGALFATDHGPAGSFIATRLGNIEQIPEPPSRRLI